MPPTEQQIKNRELASQGLPVIDSTTLNSNQNPIDFNTFIEPAVPSFTPEVLTEPEKEVSAAQKEIKRLQTESLGESATRTKLEGEADIEGKTQAIQSFQNELKLIQAEQAGLAEQQRIIPQQLQEEAAGRGITAGGLRPLETSRLRQLSIRQGLVASKGMFAAANLQAAQGDLSTALSLIDRAVESKFAPIKEEIAVKKANLELLLQDPKLSLEDKNRALRLQTQLDEQDRQIEEQKIDEAKKGEIVATAASMGADAITVRELNQAQTSQEALEIAVNKGFVSQKASTKIQFISATANQQAGTFNPSTGAFTPLQKVEVGSLPIENAFDLGLDVGEGDTFTRNGRQVTVSPTGDLIPLGVEELTPTQITEANTLAKQIYGGTTIKTKDGYNNFVIPIIERMKNGENIDEIADDLRFKGQSTAFTGVLRNAAQQITSKLSTTKTEAVFDKLDDLIGQEDIGLVRDFLKKIAIENSAGGTEQAKMIMGQERTVEFLDEIYQDLQDFEDAGGKTNIFTGTMEEIAKKVGTVKDEELRTISTKILKARQQYRRSMTGVAFSPGENKEYDAIFPNINKTMNFNTATITGLREAFRGDVDFFYSFAMGDDAYNELFKGQTKEVGTENIITAPDGQRVIITDENTGGNILTAPDGQRIEIID